MTLISKPITVIGGGLAGLSVGIHLLRKGVPVLIQEAGSYPRHRVCGEFLSGEGRTVLQSLGLEEQCLAAGARLAESVRFYSEDKSSATILLPKTALCFSRFRLDHILAEEFVRLGGELRTSHRWVGSVTEPGTILASGRRPFTRHQKWRWVGLKAHANGVELEADLEMHFSDGGYVGICDLGNGLVNVCGAFRTNTSLLRDGNDWSEMLRGATRTARHQRLRHAKFIPDTFQSVAGLGLERCCHGPGEMPRIGDGWNMIAPVSGNGMSMALEAGALAANALADYSRGTLTWNSTLELIKSECQKKFRLRLILAHRLQKAFLRPSIRSWMITAIKPWVFRGVFNLTR